MSNANVQLEILNRQLATEIYYTQGEIHKVYI